MASNWIRSPGRSRLEPEADTGAGAGMPSERPQPLLLAAPLSLSGRYTLQGRLAAAGIEQVVEDVVGLGGLAVGGRRLMPVGAILDDESTRDGLRRALEGLKGAHVLLGPYGSDLTREAARWAAERGLVLWNHGATADAVQWLPGVVSVASSASRYAASVLEALADELPGARVLLAVAPGSFGKSIAEGAREAAERLGMRIQGTVAHAEVPEAPDTDVLIAAGSYRDDVELVARLRARLPAVAAVAAAMGLFGAELGARAEGVLAPSQWEEGTRFRPNLGPSPLDVVRSLRARIIAALQLHLPGGLVDYPAAQAYATGLLAMGCIQLAETLEEKAVLEAARRLRCTTFFGRFGLGEDGRQVDHELLVIQWQGGLKRIVWPPLLAETGIAL